MQACRYNAGLVGFFRTHPKKTIRLKICNTN